MPRGPRFLIPYACYHIITRGNQQQTIFLDDADYEIYLTKIKRYKKRHNFQLYAFCLMPNHVHLVGQPEDPAGLPRFMHGLSLSYALHFNKRYKKVGHLWQDRFISKTIAKDGYLLDCIQYVENNPIRANMVKAAAEYNWSSYRERFTEETCKKGLLDELCL